MVEAVGDGAGVRPGERVYAVLFPAGGGFAELALAPADRLAPMPGTVSFVEARTVSGLDSLGQARMQRALHPGPVACSVRPGPRLALGPGTYSGCCCHLTRSNSLPSGSANVVCDTLNVAPPARMAGSLIWLSGLAPRPVSRSISSS